MEFRTKLTLALPLALALVGCRPSDDVAPAPQPEPAEPAAEKMTLPEPSGPHRIGVVDFELIDSAREETFAPGEPRRIPVRAWFPARSVSGEPRQWATDEEIEHTIRDFSRLIPISEARIASLTDVPTHSYENAIPLDSGPVPTVIFSHGGFGSRQINTALMEHLASHGYLVLSITHPYLSSGVMHENGDIVPFDQGLADGMMSWAGNPDYLAAFTAEDHGLRLEAHLRNTETFILAPHFLIWEQDYMHVIDRLETGDLPGHVQHLLPMIDMNRLGTFGMSFGASGSAAAHKDNRVKAAVNIDGGVFDSDLYDVDARMPVLVFHADGSVALPGYTMRPHSEFVYEPLISAGTRSDVIRIETAGSTHFGHTDYSLVPASVREVDKAFDASMGTIDGQRLVQIMNDFTLHFFDHYLSGEGPGFDDAFRSEYPEVTDIDLSDLREWAASNPEPGFMSYTHVLKMNRALAADAASRIEAAKLDRAYTMAFELTDGPRGGTQWWLMTFDPESGVRFSMSAPTEPADLTLSGDYTEYIRFMKRVRAGEAGEADQPVTISGNEQLMDIVGASYAAAQSAATFKTVFPDI